MKLRGKKRSSVVFHEVNGGQKHRQKKKKNWKDHHDRLGHQQSRQQLCTSRLTQHDDHARNRESTISAIPVTPVQSTVSGKQKPCPKQVGPSIPDDSEIQITDNFKVPNGQASDKSESGSLQAVLLPSTDLGRVSHTVKERKKHPRLNGADLYVARLGQIKQPAKPDKPGKKQAVNFQFRTPPAKHGDTSNDLGLCSSTASLSSGVSTSSNVGSLHDELVNPLPAPSTASACCLETSFNRGSIHASRPCYRCISYMHSAGIKRVFWTSHGGLWEGAKVRELVDALEGPIGSVGGEDGGPTGNGLFVTKHEVLMLRRKMGNDI